MSALVMIVAAATAVPQAPARCSAAERFIMAQGMATVVTADTVDDWRTRQRVPGCRITAAGATARSLAAEAGGFYDRLRAAGWVRTPDPRDAPNEASLRFRREGNDCLFNFYSGTSVGTLAEVEVNGAITPAPGESRYNLLVLCIPAMEAARN